MVPGPPRQVMPVMVSSVDEPMLDETFIASPPVPTPPDKGLRSTSTSARIGSPVISVIWISKSPVAIEFPLRAQRGQNLILELNGSRYVGMSHRGAVALFA